MSPAPWEQFRDMVKLTAAVHSPITCVVYPHASVNRSIWLPSVPGIAFLDPLTYDDALGAGPIQMRPDRYYEDDADIGKL